MPDQIAAQRQRAEDLRLMMQSSGWQHMLALIFQQLRHYEAYLGPTYPEAQRMDAIGRRGMLLDLVQHVYTEADVPSPLDQHYIGWLAHIQPPTPPPAVVTPDKEPAPVPPDPRLRRRQAGSVA